MYKSDLEISPLASVGGRHAKCKITVTNNRFKIHHRCEHMLFLASALALVQRPRCLTPQPLIHPLREKKICSRRLMRLSRFSRPDFCFFGSDFPCSSTATHDGTPRDRVNTHREHETLDVHVLGRSESQVGADLLLLRVQQAR